MPTINDLRQQAATIKNATQVGENTATRVGTTFETIADLLEGMGGVTNLSTIDIGSIDTLNTTGDMLVGTPNIYTITKTIGANTFKVGTLFQFANNGRYDVAQVIVSQFIVDADGRIDTTSADQEVHIFYRLCKTMNGGSLPTPIGTWTTWTELGGSGGSGVTIDPYPTQNSGNAVSSGGVFERLQDIAPKVDISAIDDIDEYSDMLAGVSPFYVVTKTISGNVFRIGTLMEFANQGRYILYQILATDYVLNDDGTLDTTTSENGGLKLIWRMKQFSGNPPAGVTIGVWSAWSYLSGGGVQPDNEDIDLNANDQLQFANKAYDASAFSGLGRVYLRKNIVTSGGVDKNVLTQAMMNTANTIYHIQYDYDLNGQTITLPAGCVLEFDGGSVKNGTITGNGTTVKDTDAKIFGNDVTIAGTWKNNIIRSSWFETNDDTLNNILAMNDDRATDIYITEDLTAFPAGFSGLNVASNTRVFLSATITKSTSVDETYSVFGVNNAENVSILGGLILGTRESAHATEYGMGIHISNSNNVRVSTTIKNTTGDGIYITSASLGVIIENCVFEGNGRNGISVIEAENVEVKNSTFKNIKYKAPQAGIDVEPNTATQVVRNFSIKNCIFENCQNAVDSVATHGTIENMEMLNSSVYANETITTLFLSAYTKRVRVAGCSFVGNSSANYSIAASFSDDVMFEHCNILTNKMFNITSSKVLFLNNIIEGTSSLFESFADVFFLGNTITSQGSNGMGGIVNTSFIKNILNIGGIGNNSGSAKNIFFENNKIVFNTQYLCVTLKDGKHVRFINNDMEMTGNRSLVAFNNVNDVIFSHNAIDVKSNQKLFDVTNSKDVSVMDNLITLPQTYSYQVYNGVNLLTTKSNRKGDRLFFDSIGKYAVFNGEKWVDDNNFTAALGKGATTSRPTSTELYASDAGFQYYDETLTKPTFLKVTQGSAVITKQIIQKNIVDDVYYGVNEANTLTQGENYIYKTSYHTARRFKAAFRKTNNTAYEDADELLIAETTAADNLPIKAPDPAVYPYIFFCNLAYDTTTVTAWLYNVTMEWADATGTVV